MMYTGCPGDKALEMSLSHLMLSPVLNQLAIVAGNKIMEDAKIGGITPAMLIFKGKCDD